MSLKENAHYIEVSAEVQYWEDASINGVEDVDGTLIPFRDGILWKPVIRLSDGLVLDWPAGVEVDVHYKVCNLGQYWLQDAAGRRIAKWHGYYVPAHILSQQDRADDYIVCQIGGDGRISGWEAPEIDPEEWDLLPQPESNEANAAAPTCWVRQNPGFNSGAAHMGPECPPGWVGSAQPMWASPQPVSASQEGGQPESAAHFNLKDRDGAMPKAEMRKLFEESVRQTPALARHHPLDAVEVDGVFDHYTNDDTDRLWVGFALGLRCAERLSKTQE